MRIRGMDARSQRSADADPDAAREDDERLDEELDDEELDDEADAGADEALEGEADETDDATDDERAEEDGEDDGAEEDDAARGAPRVQLRTVVIQLDELRAAQRAARERATDGAATDERIPISFSSEAPVLRMDWWEGERYLEVLDHDASSVDMSYARDGLPFLVEHQRDRQVGIVEDITFGKDRKGRGMLRLSQSAEGQAIARDIQDGIRKRVSFGYLTGDTYAQTGGETEGETPTRRYTKWTPMEVSTVSIPADVTVGPGRARHGRPPRHHPTRPARQAREHPMSVRDRAAAPAQPVAGTPNGNNGNNGSTGSTGARSVDDILRIQQMCRAARVSETATEQYLRGNLSLAEIGLALFDQAQRQAQSLLNSETTQADQLGISRGEAREYSLGRAVQALVTGNWDQAGYEREVSQALQRSTGRSTNGILVATALPLAGQRTTLAAGMANLGGNTVPQQMQGTLIELLRNKSVIDRMNPTRLPGLQGNVPIPRQTQGGTGYVQGETAGEVAESNMTFDQVNLSPKNILAQQSYYKQLFAQSIIAVDALMREDLSTILALLFDQQCLHGPGTANNISGIYAQAGVNAIAMGGAIAFGPLVDMETSINVANAALGSMGYIMTPEIIGKAKQKAELANTIGKAIFTGTVEQGEVNGYLARGTNQLAKNLGAGTNEHGIVFGAFNQAILADWGAIDITVDPFTGAGAGKVRIVAQWLVDFALRHPQAFSKGTGLTNT